jgi:hypothetical protein
MRLARFSYFYKKNKVKTRFTLWALFACACCATAQDVGSGRSLDIKPIAPETAPPPSGLPSINDPLPFPTSSGGSIEAPELNSNFGKTRDFANPNERYLDRLTKSLGEKEQSVDRKNYYLGDVKTKAEKVRIVYRDHEYPDGDMIMVRVNDMVVRGSITLDSDAQGFDLSLTKGFNKIDFEALNQGSSGPNTAEFQVYDDQGDLIASNRWNLATGFKATIIVVKE